MNPLRTKQLMEEIRLAQILANPEYWATTMIIDLLQSQKPKAKAWTYPYHFPRTSDKADLHMQIPKANFLLLIIAQLWLKKAGGLYVHDSIWWTKWWDKWRKHRQKKSLISYVALFWSFTPDRSCMALVQANYSNNLCLC